MGKFDKVLQLIKEIVEITETGDFIFRGESNGGHDNISSGLYRDPVIKNVVFDNTDTAKNLNQHDINLSLPLVKIAIKELERYKKDLYPSSSSNFEILTEVQHYEGTTMLIDFTKSLFIALFFACEKNPEKDGRVIQINTNNLELVSDLYEDDIVYHKHLLLKPINCNNRVLFQRSVFVHAPKGFIDDNLYTEIKIEKDLKNEILEYLNQYHDISFRSIYQDIYGYIKNEKKFKNANLLFYQGKKLHEEKRHTEAIEKYHQSIKENVDDGGAYHDLGLCHYAIGDLSLASQDFSKAVEIYKKKISLVNVHSNFKRIQGSMRMIGVILDDTGKHNDAIKVFSSQIVVLKNIPNQEIEIAGLLYDIGLSQERWGRKDDKVIHFQDAINSYQKAKELGYPDQELLDGKIKKLDEEMQNIQIEPEK